MSLTGDLYNKIYNRACGVHPNLYPWHFQWLGVKDLYTDLRKTLPQLDGMVLDVGCGAKPYSDWLDSSEKCIGIDIKSGPKVDLVINYTRPWPLGDNSFDVVLCTQVVEHAVDTEVMLGSITRVLKPGGILIVTAPFIFNEHGAPDDYRRFSVYGLQKLVSDRYEVVGAKREGGLEVY